jgi:hypothetical protein
MKNVLIPLIGALGLAACSNNNNTSASNDMSGSSATMDLSQPAAPDCTTYCTTVLHNCTGPTMASDAGAGLTAFSSLDSCMHACAKMPVGTAGDQAGNTLGCRLYYATQAATNPMVHCPRAMMSGGGVCGDRCASFCALATSICTVADGVTMPVFSSPTDCMAKCGQPPFAFDPNLPEEVTDSPTLNCAFYHLGEAFTSPYDVDAGTAATNSAAGGHCDDFNPNNPNRGCQ